MRRRPQIRELEIGQPLEELGPHRRPAATNRGDLIEPFLVSGGATFFLDFDEAGDPEQAGAQLVASVFVPPGRIGFLKQLRVAPFIPPELSDPWNTAGARVEAPGQGGASWRGWQGPPTPRAAGTHGVWSTPFGWESYFDAEGFPPQWLWHLRLCDGDVTRGRAALFNVADPLTWPFVQNVPVPLSAYPLGIPGRAPGNAWGPQRMQVIQGDELCTHVVVPPNTTLCLFVQWLQQTFTPRADIFDGEGNTQVAYGPAVYPLLPSFGQLHGYMQAADNTEASTENALYGWGG